MEWLRNLAAESKARRLVAKEEEAQREKEESEKEEEALKLSNTQASTEAPLNSRDSFIFRKTLVGYQGDAAITEATEEEEHASNNKDELAPQTQDATNTNRATLHSLLTPNRPLPTTKETGSSIRSILKKSTTKNVIPTSVTSKRVHVGVAESAARKPSDVKSSLRGANIGTPVRSLPRAKKQLTLESPTPSLQTSPKMMLSSTTKHHGGEKSVKWADEQNSSSTKVFKKEILVLLSFKFCFLNTFKERFDQNPNEI